MTTTTRNSYKLSLKRATKRTTRRRHPQKQKTTTTTSSSSSIASSLFNKPMHHARKCNSNKNKKNKKLSQKLEALKNLIPTHNEETVKPDQLFKETAEYIVLLRTRVVVLQKLIQYYDGNNNDQHAMFL